MLQMRNLVTEIARMLPGFDDVVYPNWDAVFTQLSRRCRPGIVLILDEFPYLVAESPELPSILQHLIDTQALMEQHTS